MSEFGEFFKIKFPNIQATIDQTHSEESILLKKACRIIWDARQAEIDQLKAEKEGLQDQLITWKGQSLAAILHGTCECGEPWQSIVSNREGFNLLHCFNCNNDRYENKEFFGDHEPKSLRGDSDQHLTR